MCAFVFSFNQSKIFQSLKTTFLTNKEKINKIKSHFKNGYLFYEQSCCDFYIGTFFYFGKREFFILNSF